MLFQVAADKEVGIVPLPVSARRFSILLLVGEHEEVDRVALEQRSVKQRLQPVLAQVLGVPDPPIGLPLLPIVTSTPAG